MPEIGGYFEEETVLTGQEPWHHTACFNSARGVLQWLLPQLQPSHVWLPRYSCEVLYHPFQQLAIPYTLYSVNEQLEPQELPAPTAGHLLLYINYNDACRHTAAALAAQWRHQCIIDNTQAFFWREPLPAWTINSARKWMGVADGAYVYAPAGQPLPALQGLQPNTRYQNRHLQLRRQGRTAEGYPVFQQNEELAGEGPALVSAWSAPLLQQAPYTHMQARRWQNFQQLHEALHHSNGWVLPQPPNTVPMYYPWLPTRPVWHEACWQQQLYVPRLWPEVASLPEAGPFEQRLASQLLPLPIDHRYDAAAMQAVIDILTSL